jgi:hypothetical protein
MIKFFSKSLRNKGEEMIYIFKNIFISKIFEVMRKPEHKDKLEWLCDLIFKMLEPSDSQQVDFFKLFKENIKDTNLLYECFSKLHDLLINNNSILTEELIDIMLFYVISGLSNPSPHTRFYSLYMFSKYVSINQNFFYNIYSKMF